MAIEKFQDLEIYMNKLVEQHLDSVQPLAMRSREELRVEIISGMTATWRLVSPQFHGVLDM